MQKALHDAVTRANSRCRVSEPSHAARIVAMTANLRLYQTFDQPIQLPNLFFLSNREALCIDITRIVYSHIAAMSSLSKRLHRI